jgi:ribonucleoside-diphosphate reductase alpha chain
MKIPFEDKRASELNQMIFETLYHGAMEASMELAKINGPYETFKGSPLSEGKF